MSNIVPIAQMQQVAKSVTESGMFGFKNSNQALTLMLLSESEGVHYMKALQQYHIINGKPALKSTEVLSRFQLAGGMIKYITSTDEVCEATFTHPQGGEITIKWDIKKAQTAGVYASNPVWKKYPSNMLRARVVSDGVNALYPACLSGALTTSQAEDIPVEVVEVIEETPQDNTKINKSLLMTKLKKLNLRESDMKEFYTKFIGDEQLEKAVTDESFLIGKIEEFEKQEIVIIEEVN